MTGPDFVRMMRIRTEAGAEGVPTITDVFYNAVGMGFLGLGIFCIMLICIVSSREARPAAIEGDEEEEEEKEETDVEEEVEDEEHQDKRQASTKKRFIDALDRLTRT